MYRGDLASRSFRGEVWSRCWHNSPCQRRYQTFWWPTPVHRVGARHIDPYRFVYLACFVDQACFAPNPSFVRALALALARRATTRVFARIMGPKTRSTHDPSMWFDWRSMTPRSCIHSGNRRWNKSESTRFMATRISSDSVAHCRWQWQAKYQRKNDPLISLAGRLWDVQRIMRCQFPLQLTINPGGHDKTDLKRLKAILTRWIQPTARVPNG